MTSFCRRVIAMRMIVANKRRIASLYFRHGLFSLTGVVLRAALRFAASSILKRRAQKLAKSSCKAALDEPR
jgi:hypothetical protein